MGLNEGSHHCHHQGKHGADYGGHATLAPPSPSKPYFCPMCPGVESDDSGDCPKCGMLLERNPAYHSTHDKTIYICPMHPEIEQDHPGIARFAVCGSSRRPASPTIRKRIGKFDLSLRSFGSA
jgi:P-type Cu+ transporter